MLFERNVPQIRGTGMRNPCEMPGIDLVSQELDTQLQYSVLHGRLKTHCQLAGANVRFRSVRPACARSTNENHAKRLQSAHCACTEVIGELVCDQQSVWRTTLLWYEYTSPVFGMRGLTMTNNIGNADIRVKNTKQITT